MRKKRMLNQYLTNDDVILRLDDTWIKYKNEPYFATCTGNKRLNLYTPDDWGTAKHRNIDANSPDVDVTSIEVGYLNTDDSAFFVTRGSVRNQKQGLCANNLFNATLGEYLAAEWAQSGCFYDMLCGKYPTFDECMKSEISRRAFDKAFMLEKIEDKMFIHFKDEICAEAKDKKFVVLDENDTLMPIYLERLGVPV